MRHLFKAEAIGNFGYVPVGLFQQYLGLLYNTTAYDIGGSFAGIFFKHFVQVIYMNGKTVGIILSGTEVQFLILRFDWELSLQQLYK